MAIEFQCIHCQRLLKLKDKCAGLTGECPYCKRVITIPKLATPTIVAPNVADTVITSTKLPTPKIAQPTATVAAEESEQPEFVAPTKKQLDYAEKLGIDIPKGVSRGTLSMLIGSAKDNQPATEKQKEFLQELGVKVPDGIRFNQISMLIDAAMNIRDEVSSATQQRLEEQWKAAGMLTEHATVEQLIQEIDRRGKPFVIFVMEDDEFHYQENLPMKGRLLWNNYLSTDDVKYLITSLGVEWSKNLDMNKYSDEYDGTPPRIEFTATEITDETATVVHLSIAPFGGLIDRSS